MIRWMHLDERSQIVDADAKIRMPIFLLHHHPKRTVKFQLPFHSVKYRAFVDHHQALVLDYGTTLVQFQLHPLQNILNRVARHLLDLRADELRKSPLVVEIQDGDLEFIILHYELLI